MVTRDRSVALVMVGGVLTLVSLVADTIGFGSHPGLGWKQLVGAAGGLCMIVIGVVGVWSKKGG